MVMVNEWFTRGHVWLLTFKPLVHFERSVNQPSQLTGGDWLVEQLAL